MEINIITLAYLGDAVYELIIREHLLQKGYIKVNDLQKQSINYVSAKAQAKFLEQIINELTEEEMAIIKRARNNKRSNHPKNTDILTYKHATSFEALIGYLYKKGNLNRLNELLTKILGEEYVCIW